MPNLRHFFVQVSLSVETKSAMKRMDYAAMRHVQLTSGKATRKLADAILAGLLRSFSHILLLLKLIYQTLIVTH